MPITLSGTRITVEWQSGDPKGDSWSNPYTLQDVVAASDAGGWNPAVTNVDYFFAIPYSLWIVGEGTYFALNTNWAPGYYVLFTATAPTDVYQFRASDNARIRIGWHGDFGGNDNTYPVYVACSYSVPSINRRVYLAALEVEVTFTTFVYWQYTYIYGNSTNNAKINNVTAQEVQYGIATNDYTEVLYLRSFGGYYGWQFVNAYSIENVELLQHTVGILLNVSSGVKILRNVKTKYNIILDVYMRCGNTADKQAYFIDSEIDQNKVGFYTSGSYSSENRNEIFLQTTMSFYIFDDQGDDAGVANVKLYDQQDNLLLDDDTVDGELLDQVITYFSSWRTLDGNQQTIDEDSFDRQPMKVVMSKSGFSDLEISNIYITAGVSTEIRGVMVNPIYADPAPEVELEDEPTTISITEVETE